MSAPDGWYLRTPRGASEPEDLWAAARQRGVEAGGQLRVAAPDEGPALSPTPQRRLRFAGAITDGPTDLSANADRYLSEGFGER